LCVLRMGWGVGRRVDTSGEAVVCLMLRVFYRFPGAPARQIYKEGREGESNRTSLCVCGCGEEEHERCFFSPHPFSTSFVTSHR
jgi:hypothetical protein